jgi:hypothetical protein
MSSGESLLLPSPVFLLIYIRSFRKPPGLPNPLLELPADKDRIIEKIVLKPKLKGRRSSAQSLAINT